MTVTIRDHRLRYALSNEFHARPFAELRAPERVSHIALFSDASGAAAERAHLLALCQRYGIAQPPEEANHFAADCGPFRVKWERHAEVATYTIFRHGAFDDPFAEPVLDLVAEDWLAALPGALLSAVHVALVPREAPEPSAESLDRLFVAESLCGSRVAGGNARLWTDFRIHEDGFGRILVRDLGLGPTQAGRVIQRLLEIETYRMMALLALPPAQEAGPEITRVDRELAALIQEMSDVRDLKDEHGLLDRLTRLSAQVEGVTAATAFRFSAARAYYALVEARLAKLREERVHGLQTIRGFMDRRLVPAMRTCESVAARQEALSQRVTRAANLLRTRVDIALEGQNRDLLASMDRRARLQLRLQQTVEGLSVAAITYYVVGLVGYAGEALASAGVTVNLALVRGLAIPVVALAVWAGLHRVRRSLAKLQGGAEDDT